jgi:hypothetical protein
VTDRWGDESEGGARSRTPLEALLLALRHSRAAHLTGSTILRQVLGSRYRELVRDGGFDLEPVWDLLSSQPGFEPAEVIPALAKLKTWEPRAGMSILLPPSMAHLTEADIIELAATVHVPTAELQSVWRGRKVETDSVELLEGPQPDARRRSTPRMKALDRDATPVEAVPLDGPKKPDRFSPRQRRTLTIAAAMTALLSLAFVAYTLIRSAENRSWDSLGLEFAGDIPLEKAERSGPEVASTLRDTSWLALPDATRKAHMRAALSELPSDVEVFFVRDAAGAVRASARWFGSPKQIAVTLR